MFIRRILTYLLMILVLASCGRHESSYRHSSAKDLKVDILLPTTPVKDQGRTELCWAYAMLATVETDRLAMGDSVNLSPLWLERRSLEEQADNAFFTDAPISLRGTLPEAMRLMQKYGIVAWDAYHPDTSTLSCNTLQDTQDTPSPPSSSTTARKVQQLAKVAEARQQRLDAFRSSLADLLDSDLGPAPLRVYMLGTEYTPLEFTHSVCLPGEWKAYTSFTHHPYNQPFAVEVPDNRQGHTAMNIPVAALFNKVVMSLRHHHPVAWEGTMKDEGITMKGEGITMKGEGLRMKDKGFWPDIQNTRQRLFERHILTDDHCMAIIGMAHNADGEPVFVCKNSWGIRDGNHGLRYMTARQFMLSTIMIMSKE